METLSIVVPCYNEYRRLPVKAFIGFVGAHDWVTFIFVNDGSQDKTQDLIDGICTAHPDRVQSLQLFQNQGKAEAIRQGILRAAETDAAFIAFWDADLATPLDAVSALCMELKTKGLRAVMGSRVKLLGRHITREPIRHYLGRVFATMASLTVGVPIYDTQCGAKVFRNDEMLKGVFAEPFSTRWTFDVEMLCRYKAALEQFNLHFEDGVVEYPLDKWAHVSGSKVGAYDFLVSFFELCRLARRVRTGSFRHGSFAP